MSWTANCEASFGRTPLPNQMSVKELEEILTLVGDEEVKAIKEGTETMYDGTVGKFLPDKSKPMFFHVFLTSFLTFNIWLIFGKL